MGTDEAQMGKSFVRRCRGLTPIPLAEFHRRKSAESADAFALSVFHLWPSVAEFI
jgi:hypothetical protein